jgi:hypothetical protein
MGATPQEKSLHIPQETEPGDFRGAVMVAAQYEQPLRVPGSGLAQRANHIHGL